MGLLSMQLYVTVHQVVGGQGSRGHIVTATGHSLGAGGIVHKLHFIHLYEVINETLCKSIGVLPFY